ncbi:hypothetical protein [Aeromicrobium duanguangcaii]|uniref:Methyl-accepting chemotaxis protein n=1 Tax=Aeromicrobium duanguangcaii TaxID=2968086 RepID=A0ABY5KH31_9ACTN|nr:hypothetical protein [Aeromicrobium duanguangcaii]MCD9153117.1 hypothetical protein [Aeromicrobium duanguangcaii]UUI69782.1 hypothetical protein NP095_06725 [Aeromicrobium duanguangcaii]
MSDERTTCAESLERLAADPRFDTRADDLRSLAAAVRDQGDGTWTGIDLVGAFPPEASINVTKMHWWERIVGIAAGASVFLPVAWTWWSIYRASEAYRELLDAGDEKGRTFLGMWTTGFDGRVGAWHEFGATAMVSFGLVTLAVLLVVLNRWVSDHYMFKEESSGGAARRELVAVLGRAQRFLNERRTDDPRFLEAALKRSVAELNEAHGATREGVEELRQATTEAVTRFEGAANKILEDLRPLLQSADSASRTFAESAESAAGLQEKVLTSAQNFDETLRGALTSFQDTVSSSTTALSDSSRTAATTLTSGVSAAVDGLTDGVKRIEAAQRSTESWLVEGVGTQARATEAAQRAAADLSRILEAHQSALQGQSSDLSRAADLAGQLLDELRSAGVVR